MNKSEKLFVVKNALVTLSISLVAVFVFVTSGFPTENALLDSDSDNLVGFGKVKTSMASNISAENALASVPKYVVDRGAYGGTNSQDFTNDQDDSFAQDSDNDIDEYNQDLAAKQALFFKKSSQDEIDYALANRSAVRGARVVSATNADVLGGANADVLGGINADVLGGANASVLDGVRNSEPVAKIGDTTYNTLQAAFNACQPGDTIKLLKDKITVKDYGSDSYGKWTEISTQSITGADIGTPMDDDALANLVLRKESADPNTPNTLINSYNGSTAPSGYITIEGADNGGTQVGSLDLSGADYIKIKNLNFDVTTPVCAYSYYGYKTGDTPYEFTSNKDKVSYATKLSHKQSGYWANIVDCNYSGGNLAGCPDTNSGAAMDIEISGCKFFGSTSEVTGGSCCISASSSGNNSYRQTDWDINNCTFDCTCSKVLNAAYFLNYPGMGHSDTITFTNNVCGSDQNGFADDIVCAGTGCFGNFNYSDNVFYNWCAYKILEDDGGAFWIVHVNNSTGSHFTIKNNQFNYTTLELSQLSQLSTIRLRFNVEPEANKLTLNGVAYDAANKEAFFEAFSGQDAGNTHPGWGKYESGSDVFPGQGLRWLYTTQVSFDAAGGTPIPDSQVIINGTKATEPADPTKQGVQFEGWFASGATTPFDFENTDILQPILLTAKWDSYHTVTFDANGGTPAPQAQTVHDGDKATRPVTDPSKVGHTFVGWFNGNEEYDFDQPVTSNTTLTAKYEANKYTVSYELNGGSWAEGYTAPEEYTYGVEATLPTLYDALKYGCILVGWYDNPELSGEPIETISATDIGNKQYYASWVDIMCKVTFDTAGGSAIPSQSVLFGTCATDPGEPTKEGYEFAGWMYNDALGEVKTAFDFSTPVYTDISVSAAWKTVTGEVIVVVPDIPIDEVTGQEVVVVDDESKTIAQNHAEQIVEDAKAGKQHTGLTEEQLTEMKEVLESVGPNETSITVLEPTVEDYNKEVPEEERGIIQNASLPNSEIACSYDFSMKLVVKVVDSAGSIVESKSFETDLKTLDKDKAVDYKVRLNLPDEIYDKCGIQVLKVHEMVASDITSVCDINREEHYADVPAYEFSTYLVNVSNDLYLTFDSMGGSSVEKQTVKFNNVPVKPADPTRSGYTFSGWYTEKECQNAFDFDEPLTLQQTVYAKWTENGGGGGGDKPGSGGGTAGSTSVSKAASTGDSLGLFGVLLVVCCIGTCAVFIVSKKRRII